MCAFVCSLESLCISDHAFRSRSSKCAEGSSPHRHEAGVHPRCIEPATISKHHHEPALDRYFVLRGVRMCACPSGVAQIAPTTNRASGADITTRDHFLPFALVRTSPKSGALHNLWVHFHVQLVQRNVWLAAEVKVLPHQERAGWARPPDARCTGQICSTTHQA